MPQRVAAKSIHRQEKCVQRQHNCPDADAEMFRAGQVGEPHPQPRVIRQQDDKEEREVKKVAVHILDDERERAFAEKRFASLADGTVDRVRPKCLVIRAAIIIAGETETGRRPQNQKCRRERQPARPPRRQLTKGMRRGAPEFRRIER